MYDASVYPDMANICKTPIKQSPMQWTTLCSAVIQTKQTCKTKTFINLFSVFNVQFAWNLTHHKSIRNKSQVS